MKVISATIILLLCGVASENVFSSVRSIQNCLTGFHRHRAAIRSVLDKGIQDVNIYNEYDLEEIEAVFQDLDKCDPDTMVHPLNALRAIRRLKALRLLLKMCEGKMEVLSDYVDMLPYHTDEVGALHALLRLQKSYDLNPFDIIRGYLKGALATFKLQPIDVLDIAKISFQANLFKNALTWVDAMNETDTMDRSVLIEAEQVASSILLKHHHYEDAKERVEKVLERYPGDKVLGATVRLIEQKLSGKTPARKDIVDNARGRTYDWPICGDPNITNFRTNTLVCLYKPGVLPYVRYKEELLSDSPRVSLFYNVMTEREANFIKHLASPLLQRSKVSTGYDKRIISKERVGHSSWLSDSLHPEVVELSRRVQDITGLSTAAHDEHNHDAEDFQVCNYGMGGQVTLHCDTAKGNSAEVKERNAIGGEVPYRIATFLIYLSDVELGGGTVFPNLKLYISPMKHAAAFWHNIHRSGVRDEKTLHAACPVIVGDKWIANKWITEDPQMFRRPCGLQPED